MAVPVITADPADLEVLGEFGHQMEDAPVDPRAVWRAKARPEQLLPPGDWRVCYWQGGRGCIAPWTRIWLPLENRHERVDVLAAAGSPVTVLALTEDGPRLAATDGAPFVKGTAELYEVATDDGRMVTVTAQHRFLTPRGWRRLADVRAGQLLAAGFPAPLPGAASCLADDDGRGDRHRTRTGEGSQAGCRTRLRSRDERPLPGSGSGRSAVPSRGGAAVRNPPGSRADALAFSPGCSRVDPLHSRPPRTRSVPAAPWPEAGGYPGLAAVVALSLRSRREQRTSPCSSSALLPSGATRPRPREPLTAWSWPGAPETSCNPYAAYPNFTAWTVLSSVRHAGTGEFYDLTVPGPANYLAEGLWHHNSGKNMSCSNAMAEWVLSDSDGEGEYGIIGPTYADAWTKQVEGKSGLLRALGTSMGEIKDHRSKTVRGAWRTYGQVLLHNGITVYVDSAAEGGLRVQGRNLKGAWCSEIGLWDKWELAWKESVNFAVRDGRSQIIADGTPKASRKARKLIRSLIRNDPEHGGVIIRKLRTRDNIKNLSEAFVRAVIGGFRGTRLELQELEGELLDDVANALWTRDLLDAVKCPAVGADGGPPYLLKTYIGVDPSDGSEDSDEQAYTVIGKGAPEDNHLYVAESWGGQESPAPFAKRVIRRAIEWNATVIVEKNHGGKWLTEVFSQAQKDMGTHVRVVMVHASDAKRARAEPVAVMYDRISEDGRPLVLHCHRTWTDDEGHLQVDEHMPELEDCMATFTGAAGEKSPDRLDSLVWAATLFLRETFGPHGMPGVRRWAAAQELSDLGLGEETRAAQKMRVIQERAAGPDGAPWDLDGFAPGEDRGEDTPGPRNNVRRFAGT